MSATTIEKAETQAAKDLREFSILLSFAEGDIYKDVWIVDPETSMDEVIAAIHASATDDSRDWECVGRGLNDRSYSDILCADVPQGRIRVRRNGRLVTVLEFRQSGGFMLCDDVTIFGPDGNELKG